MLPGYDKGMRFIPIIILIGLGCSKGAEPEQAETKPTERERVEFHKELLTESELRALPNIRGMDSLSIGSKPDFQIIHIRNWHFVDCKAFEADGGKDWEAFLKSVEAVQEQQIEVLKHLRDNHGIKAVFLEGMTDADMDEYKKLAEALVTWKEPAGNDPMSQFLRQQHRKDTLLLGASACVEDLEILPAEEAMTLQNADPQKPGYDLEANEKRENAIVKRLRSSGHRIAVIILGGSTV